MPLHSSGKKTDLRTHCPVAARWMWASCGGQCVLPSLVQGWIVDLRFRANYFQYKSESQGLDRLHLIGSELPFLLHAVAFSGVLVRPSLGDTAHSDLPDVGLPRQISLLALALPHACIGNGQQDSRPATSVQVLSAQRISNSHNNPGVQPALHVSFVVVK
jgi:hypothetical protein